MFQNAFGWKCSHGLDIAKSFKCGVDLDHIAHDEVSRDLNFLHARAMIQLEKFATMVHQLRDKALDLSECMIGSCEIF